MQQRSTCIGMGGKASLTQGRGATGGGNVITTIFSSHSNKHKLEKNTQHHRRGKQHLGFDFFVFSLKCDIISHCIVRQKSISGNIQKLFINLMILAPRQVFSSEGTKGGMQYCYFLQINIISQSLFSSFISIVFLNYNKAPQLQHDRTSQFYL